jgi:hypothetical protein
MDKYKQGNSHFNNLNFGLAYDCYLEAMNKYSSKKGNEDFIGEFNLNLARTLCIMNKLEEALEYYYDYLDF